MAATRKIPAPSRGAAFDAATMGEAFCASATEYADRVALRAPDAGIELTWGRFAQEVHRAAAALHQLGLRPGDTLALMLSNRPEFHVIDAAALCLGLTSFSLSNAYQPEEIRYVTSDAGARVIVTEQALLAGPRAATELADSSIGAVIVIDGDPADGAIAWAQLLQDADVAALDLDAASRAVRSEDVATLIYATGPTGPPRGVELTHGNLLSMVDSIHERVRIPVNCRAISCLPMAHVAERLCGHYVAMMFGFEVTTCPAPQDVVALLRQVQPHFFVAPPQLWEQVGADVGTGRDDIGLGEIRVALVVGAPCPSEVIASFHAIGVPLGQLYGVPESTGAITCNPAERFRSGTVGPALRDVEVKLAHNGEVLARGPNVMVGYRNLPEQTAQTIGADGWLRTGAIGALDADGYLEILDVTSSTRARPLRGAARGPRRSPPAGSGRIGLAR